MTVTADGRIAVTMAQAQEALEHGPCSMSLLQAKYAALQSECMKALDSVQTLDDVKPILRLLIDRLR